MTPYALTTLKSSYMSISKLNFPRSPPTFYIIIYNVIYVTFLNEAMFLMFWLILITMFCF